MDNRTKRIIKVFCWNKIKEIGTFIGAIIVIALILAACVATGMGLCYGVGYLLLLIPAVVNLFEFKTIGHDQYHDVGMAVLLSLTLLGFIGKGIYDGCIWIKDWIIDNAELAVRTVDREIAEEKEHA